jgi:hypothetical protein
MMKPIESCILQGFLPPSHILPNQQILVLSDLPNNDFYILLYYYLEHEQIYLITTLKKRANSAA